MLGWAGYETLVAGLTLPDPKDRHVLAAAIRGRAELIVTANLTDFPDAALRPLGLHALSPDAFLLDQLNLNPAQTIAAIIDQATAARTPPLSLDDLLAALARAGVPNFAGEVRSLTER
jgi:hypothetical protein